MATRGNGSLNIGRTSEVMDLEEKLEKASAFLQDIEKEIESLRIEIYTRINEELEKFFGYSGYITEQKAELIVGQDELIFETSSTTTYPLDSVEIREEFLTIEESVYLEHRERVSKIDRAYKSTWKEKDRMEN